jgi:hypothetical protein
MTASDMAVFLKIDIWDIWLSVADIFFEGSMEEYSVLGDESD